MSRLLPRRSDVAANTRERCGVVPIGKGCLDCFGQHMWCDLYPDSRRKNGSSGATKNRVCGCCAQYCQKWLRRVVIVPQVAKGLEQQDMGVKTIEFTQTPI